ncbi:DUF2703 domain-containing protein [Natronobiforma cellulositropha]|uniref:DUF2703 domain-containing protein n=1 Tax=Natronobiforma cellulositropha TaxID=1679076 RepID=UPI0021D5A38E|nr:DUF2703 domain-containing protein [Natronobiforma cellulositropha]
MHPAVTVETRAARSYAKQTIVVDFFFLEESCGRCHETERALEEAISSVAPLFDRIGAELELRKVPISGVDDARHARLEVLPTIRIDGRDAQPQYVEHAAYESLTGETGGDHSGCRLWVEDGAVGQTPSAELLVESLLVAVGRAAGENAPAYRVPAGLQSYFEDTDSCAVTDESCES